ncbi:MAG TPA: cupredoxin domain-containing protein [Nevskiaceae bacterium]|nr:cupredoxin domain-containing protein [Nevskiaceae bacterium]
MRVYGRHVACLGGLAWFVCAVALAAPPVVHVKIVKQAFVPQQLAVPANEKVKLLVHNVDSMPAEFESYELSREVIVPGHATVAVFVGPLKPGDYAFFNDFHPSSKGTVVAK